ncbi:MAG TPA: hypothetical protein VFY45_00575 [Baekduia sp.]|nr:hypothetical protein [Baekduia sp.]
MSAQEGSFGCRITVSPSDADVLRIEAKKVLMFNHEPFEDFLDYIPTKQLALADVFRDATAVIDALGWDPDTNPRYASVQVPITAGHIHQLQRRRCDLLDTNLDLLEDIGADAESLAFIMAEIHANRDAVEGLNRIFDAHSTTIGRGRR